MHAPCLASEPSVDEARLAQQTQDVEVQPDFEELPGRPRLTALRHPNLLEVFGHCNCNGIGIVTAWQDNGDIKGYLDANPDAARLPLLLGVANGLAYLHGLTLVHGNIHPWNVLISGSNTALLADYIVIEHLPDSNGSSMRPMHIAHKTMFVAPEVQTGDGRSAASDVFAFGMLVFYAYGDANTSRHGQTAVAACATLINGGRPKREEIERSDFTEKLWELTTKCWAQEARLRPPITEIQEVLHI
ncbi:kinase-like protein [Auricularia subglabra TFB-10046 SS5]|uniref:Kinase-like protein n=1 Tax=Auricularia subglabra (strain TFB-10046 / SS5) TaxID=717982 RepID=J0WLP7_AURST|nr:kinase-like protein [Auricularia subglabra TFB-10046 SS5]